MNLRSVLFRLLLVLLASSGFLGRASAQSTQWVSGGITQMTGTNCSILGAPYTESMLNGFASYQRYTDQSAPKTGDSTYVSVVMSVPGLNCNPDSSVGVIPALVLPQGASLNITAQTPVRCLYRINNQPWAQFTGTTIGINSTQGTGLRVGPICPDGQGGGVGNPFQIGLSGTYGGLALAIQYLPRTSWLEIQVPIKFEKELLGVGGPNGGDRLKFIFDTVGLSPNPASAETFINVPYRAVINYPTPATSITASSAQLNADLLSYFKGGTAFFDYGPSTAYGSSASQNIANTLVGYNVFNDVTGLTPGTTYNYRLRYVTASGTFTGANRTFTTSAAPNQTLTVIKSGAGTGTVSSSPAGINTCAAQCSASFAQGSSVTLTATPATGSSFAGWSGGGCSGAAATCTVSVNAATSVTANFGRLFGSLSYTLTGLPTGTSATLALTGPDGYNTTVTLLTGLGQSLSDMVVGAYTITAPDVTVGNAVYASNARSQTVTVTATGNATINVVYSAVTTQTLALTVTRAGTGTGTVSSQPAGINCGATCTANFAAGSSVILTAAPLAGSSFTGWGGVCNGTASTCTVTMSAVQTVTVSFATTPPAPTNFALTVTPSGTGAGSVSSNPGGIACGAACVANFGQASSVTLTATPDAGSSFAGWGGACSGSGACVVTMSAAQGVTATFTLNAPTSPAASLGKPSGSPANVTASTSERNVGALGLELGAGSASTVTLKSLAVSASGTGNDALDITGVKVYVDTNGNGTVDPGEPALAQGTFSGNDGAATLTLAAPRVFAANSTTRLLVTLDFNSSLAQTSFPLAFGLASLTLLVGRRSRRRLPVAGLLALAVTLSACSPPVTPPTGSSTYAVSLTAIDLEDSSSATINVGGLPITGTTITVAR